MSVSSAVREILVGKEGEQMSDRKKKGLILFTFGISIGLVAGLLFLWSVLNQLK